MTDPIEQASYRAAEYLKGLGLQRFGDRVIAYFGAREALKPLRERHKRTEGGFCSTCRDPKDSHWAAIWPCEEAKHIYPESEL